jgi:rare lipoprotein A
VEHGGFIVQAATFSTADRATRVADALGGAVIPAGQYFRVRTGPFATRGEAEASLAKVRAAGYRDARIFTSG